jgi:hypothetical protein
MAKLRLSESQQAFKVCTVDLFFEGDSVNSLIYSTPCGGDKMGRDPAQSENVGHGHVCKHGVQPGSRYGVIFMPTVVRLEGAARG